MYNVHSLKYTPDKGDFVKIQDLSLTPNNNVALSKSECHDSTLVKILVLILYKRLFFLVDLHKFTQ